MFSLVSVARQKIAFLPFLLNVPAESMFVVLSAMESWKRCRYKTSANLEFMQGLWSREPIQQTLVSLYFFIPVSANFIEKAIFNKLV